MSGYSNTAYQEHSEEVSAGHNASSLAAHQQDLITPVILERATAHMNIQGTSAAGTTYLTLPLTLLCWKFNENLKIHQSKGVCQSAYSYDDGRRLVGASGYVKQARF